MNIDQAIFDLADYAVRVGLMEEDDRVWGINRLLDAVKRTDFQQPETAQERPLEDILQDIPDYAVEQGVIEDGVTSRDLFDTELMGRLTPRPSQVRKKFAELYQESPEKATDWYYQLSQNSDYIRRYRIARDMKWVTPTAYGDLDITINLSKPEKDPRAIAAARRLPRAAIPSASSAGRTRAIWAA